jgi:hypothetical protein
LQEAHEQENTSFQVSHPPKEFPNYVALMFSITDSEPFGYEEAIIEKVW